MVSANNAYAYHNARIIDEFFDDLNPKLFSSIDAEKLDEISKISDTYRHMIEDQLKVQKNISKNSRTSFFKSNDTDLINQTGFFKTRLSLAIEKTITSSEKIGLNRKDDAEKVAFVLLTVDPNFEYLQVAKDNAHLGGEAIASILFEKFNLCKTNLLKWELVLSKRFPELFQKEEEKKSR